MITALDLHEMLEIVKKEKIDLIVSDIECRKYWE